MTEPSLLPKVASPLRRTIEEASLRSTQIPLNIRDLDDFDNVSSNFLPFLAWGLGVDVWDTNWPDWKKRAVISRSIADHRLKGTLAGARRFIEIADAELVEFRVPPDGFFAGEDLTAEEWESYLQLHPKVRLTLFKGAGVWNPPQDFFSDECFSDEDMTGIPNADRVLYGRKAFLVVDGESIPLDTSTVTISTDGGVATEYERFVIPGEARDAVISDDMFVGQGFVDSFDLEPAYYTFGVDRSYTKDTSFVSVGTLAPGFEPRTYRFVRESEDGEGGDAFFSGADFADQEFATFDDASFLIGDVVRLLDPTVAAPQTAGISFADYSRAGMAAHHAELLIDWRGTMDVSLEFACELSFSDTDFVPPHDTKRRDFVLDAVTISKRLSDKIGVTFQTHRAPTLGDGVKLNGAVKLGDLVRNTL